jgi:hypothetical protein
MMMDMRKYAGETFLKLEHVRSGPLQATIAEVRLGKFDKPNLILDDGQALSVNATNNSTLIRAYGPNSDDWLGKEIELYAGEVEFQGKQMEAVLVRPISPPLKTSERTKLPPPEAAFGTPKSTKAPAKKSGGNADFGDEIPY